MRGGMQVPARLLPLARLLEVVIHHVDLDIGYEITDIDTQTAEWLLEWCAFRLRDRDDFPRLQLTSETGVTTTVGSVGEPLAVSGSSAHLLGWLMAVPSVRPHRGRRAPAPGILMLGFNHVEPGGPPLVVRLSGSVTMIKVSVGPVDNNAYLLQNRSGRSLLIDAANDDDRLLKIISDQPLDTIVTTHRHADHWQALPSVAAATGARLICGQPDLDAISTGARVEDMVGVWDGDHVELGTERLEVIGLVGHTPGSITLSYADTGMTHLFTGDSLFPGGPGQDQQLQRTSLP